MTIPPDRRTVGLALVILAAGRSTRFGRLKQLEPVGPGGEALLDYAIRDAALAGFERCVLVIQEALEPAFDAHLAQAGWQRSDASGRARVPGRTGGARQSGRQVGFSRETNAPREIEVRYAFQSLAHPELVPVPPIGRSRPWGTGFAVIAAGEHLDGLFAVCNADDFYGRAAYAALAAALKGIPREAPGRQGPRGPATRVPHRHRPGRRSPDESFAAASPVHAFTVGYPVGSTLSPSGGVSRGICEIDDQGALLRLTEGLNLCRDGDLASGHDPSGRPLSVPLDAPVCTNLWGFHPAILPLLRERFGAFLAAGPGPGREFYLSEAINDLIVAGQVRCTVLPTRARWLGVTFPGDHAGVARALRDMVEYQPCNLPPSTGSSSRSTG